MGVFVRAMKGVVCDCLIKRNGVVCVYKSIERDLERMLI